MKNDRYIKVEVSCERCGTVFLARRTRVRDGLARFCSRSCYNETQRDVAKNTLWGRKDLATKYKIGGRYCARWYDENGKTCSTSYARWWWEMNVGEIPNKMYVIHKDNDPMNLDSSNFILGTKKDVTDKGKETLRKEGRWKESVRKRAEKITGRKATQETRDKISKANSGRKFTIEQRNKFSNKLVQLWKDGVFDFHKGKSNKHWKEGKTRHPKEFNDDLKEFIRQRDNNLCQICGKDMSNSVKKGIVHHIDGIKANSDPDNLIYLCSSCHMKVHFTTGNTSPVIMTFREKLID